MSVRKVTETHLIVALVVGLAQDIGLFPTFQTDTYTTAKALEESTCIRPSIGVNAALKINKHIELVFNKSCCDSRDLRASSLKGR